MFQQVTEVFHLRHLISTQPRGMLFQLVLAMLMHNVVQVVKKVIVQEHGREEKRVSTEMLFRDVQEEIQGLARLVPVAAVVGLIADYATPAAVWQRLRELLGGCWCQRWQKANYRPRDPSKPAKAKPESEQLTRPR